MINFIDSKMARKQNLYSSFSSIIKNSFISRMEDNDFNCMRLFYNMKANSNDLNICLYIYQADFLQNFLISPQVILLTFDLISEDSFNKMVNYYKSCKQDKKTNNSKFVIVGIKDGLIKEEPEKENEKDKDIDPLNEDKEKNNNKDFKNKGNKLKKRIEVFCKDNNIIISEEINGITGEGINELFVKVIKLLFMEIQMKELETKIFENLLIEEPGRTIEKELEITSQKENFLSIEHKKEVDKINKKNNICCFSCSIF